MERREFSSRSLKRRFAIGVLSVASLGLVVGGFPSVAGGGISNLTIPMHNDVAPVGTDCPAGGGTFWHFVIVPNNGHSAFVEFRLNLNNGVGAPDIHTFTGFPPIITNGGQTDNVFVEVPGGHSLGDLNLTGSDADITFDGIGQQPTRFNLSHVCGGETIDTGTLSVRKVVNGGSSEPTTFTVHVQCTNNLIDEDIEFNFTPPSTVDPDPKTYTGIPLGTVCTVTEPNPPSGFTPTFDPATAPDPGVTIAVKDQTVSVTVTNDPGTTTTTTTRPEEDEDEEPEEPAPVAVPTPIVAAAPFTG